MRSLCCSNRWSAAGIACTQQRLWAIQCRCLHATAVLGADLLLLLAWRSNENTVVKTLNVKPMTDGAGIMISLSASAFSALYMPIANACWDSIAQWLLYCAFLGLVRGRIRSTLLTFWS